MSLVAALLLLFCPSVAWGGPEYFQFSSQNEQGVEATVTGFVVSTPEQARHVQEYIVHTINKIPGKKEITGATVTALDKNQADGFGVTTSVKEAGITAEAPEKKSFLAGVSKALSFKHFSIRLPARVRKSLDNSLTRTIILISIARGLIGAQATQIKLATVEPMHVLHYSAALIASAVLGYGMVTVQKKIFVPWFKGKSLFSTAKETESSTLMFTAKVSVSAMVFSYLVMLVTLRPDLYDFSLDGFIRFVRGAVLYAVACAPFARALAKNVEIDARQRAKDLGVPYEGLSQDDKDRQIIHILLLGMVAKAMLRWDVYDLISPIITYGSLIGTEAVVYGYVESKERGGLKATYGQIKEYAGKLQCLPLSIHK